jgi:putative ABC transport system permease protein
LGASVNKVVYLITKDFLLLVAIAVVVASPLAYYFMKKWLQDFAYRVTISSMPFIIAGVAAFVIALITVGIIAQNAAKRNPVDSIKYE